jgi:pantetheine-phosphate adenylyltransferase
VCLGGTFNRLHEGHRLLFQTAFEVGDLVRVGVTSDALVKKLRGARARSVRPFEERLAGVWRLVRPFGEDRVSVVALDDPLAPVDRPEFDAIVVSLDTVHTAEKINAMRRERGLATLKVVIVPMLMAFDGKPISATRILAGEIDEAGRPVRGRAQGAPKKKARGRGTARASGRKAAGKRAPARCAARKGSRAGGPRARR